MTVSPSRLTSLRGEADLREPLGVEEVGRLEVAGEVLVLDVHARDLGRALEADRVLADDEGGVDLAEAALERPAEVLDLEADSGVHRVELPGAGRSDRQCLSIAHL